MIIRLWSDEITWMWYYVEGVLNLKWMKLYKKTKSDDDKWTHSDKHLAWGWILQLFMLWVPRLVHVSVFYWNFRLEIVLIFLYSSSNMQKYYWISVILSTDDWVVNFFNEILFFLQNLFFFLRNLCILLFRNDFYFTNFGFKRKYFFEMWRKLFVVRTHWKIALQKNASSISA